MAPDPSRTQQLERHAERFERARSERADDETDSQSSRPASREMERPSTGDREELIRRIKRGENPQWTPSEQLLRLLAENVNEDRNLAPIHGDVRKNRMRADGTDLAQAEYIPIATPTSDAMRIDNLAAGLEIPRPRSALHSGDFSVHNPADEATRDLQSFQTGPIATSPPRPTSRKLPKSWLPIAKSSVRDSLTITDSPRPTSIRPRAPSLQSASPSYVLKPATSPLVCQTNNEDLSLEDFMDLDSPSRRNRRHTMNMVGSLPNTNKYSDFTQAARLPASLRKENSSPWSGAGHRRSLNAAFSYQLASSPQTPPFYRSRAPSFSSDASPRQTSMLGSYEESILRGRMSGNPSQPLNFTAELGVVARNKHKPSCPPHVHVEFPAVYYSWPTGHGRVGSVAQEPSPYVGRIDLEHNLAPPKPKEGRQKQRRMPNDVGDEIMADLNVSNDQDQRKKRKRENSSSQEGLLGGSYRIPQQGSLQIIIRNPNKSAAKVFIVPYDLDGMATGTKTWVRQRCYSAGPIIENPISSSLKSIKGHSIEQNRSDPRSKPTLRYLIHLKICSPTKGRYYLYDEIRVVFANRVPDNKESLRYEVQMPDPKFSAFRPPQRQSIVPTDSNVLETPESQDERTLRRRSYGVASSNPMFRSMPVSASNPQSISNATPSTPVPAVASSFITRPRTFTAGATSEQEVTDADTASSGSLYVLSPSTDYWGRRTLGHVTSPQQQHSKTTGMKERTYDDMPSSSALKGTKEGDESRFAKLKQEDNRYGGSYGRPATPEPGEGLIARRLRSLEVDERDGSDDT